MAWAPTLNAIIQKKSSERAQPVAQNDPDRNWVPNGLTTLRHPAAQNVLLLLLPRRKKEKKEKKKKDLSITIKVLRENKKTRHDNV